MAAGRDELAVLPPSCLPDSGEDRKEAVLAAIGAGWAMGLSPDLIGAALRTFEWNTKKN
jgi:cyanophycin synthetase